MVPVINARYALNAANARWGSLYDALYGTDAIPETAGAVRAMPTTRSAAQGDGVGAGVPRPAVPLTSGSHADAPPGTVIDGANSSSNRATAAAGLAQPDEVRRLPRASTDAPTACCFVHHGLGIEIVRSSRDARSDRADAAGVTDVVLESAVTTIVDFEDSVAAVDADDKVAGYRNWLGLMTRRPGRARSPRAAQDVHARDLEPDSGSRAPDGASSPARAFAAARPQRRVT